MSGINWKLEDDFKAVTVTFPTDPPVAVKLDVAEVENMLRNLGEFRAAMKPEVARDFAFGQKVVAIPDPIWRTEPDAMLGHSLLHLRDPRYGWLHFLLPPASAQKLGELLQAQAQTEPAALTRPGNIN